MPTKVTKAKPAQPAAKGKTVDDYIAGLTGWQAEVVSSLRQIIRQAAPGASESIKWAQPVYESNGPFAFVRAFTNNVNFGFWRGAQLTDPHGLLEGDGEKMRHVKIMSVKDIRKKEFQQFVKEAVRLNQIDGDPTKGS